MQAFAAGGFAEAEEPERIEAIANLPGTCDHGGECDIRRGIEIEYQPARNSGLVRLTIPRMQLDAADLRDLGERLDIIDLQIRLVLAGRFYEIEKLPSA